MPPVTDTVWSLPLERLPSMSRMAAGTEPPSCSRGERRWGLGRGKCVMLLDTIPPAPGNNEITEAATKHSEGPKTRATKAIQGNEIRAAAEGQCPNGQNGHVT